MLPNQIEANARKISDAPGGLLFTTAAAELARELGIAELIVK